MFNDLPTSLTKLRDAFLEALRLRGQAPATIAARSRGLDTFMAWLWDYGVSDVREISGATLRAYRRWLSAQPYALLTIHVKIAAVRGFLKHLETLGGATYDLCADLLPPKLGDPLPRAVLTRAEARRALAMPDGQTKKGLRDQAILELFNSTGLRGDEMARLTVDDVDHGNELLRVRHGKGARERVVPAGSLACAAVRAYLRGARSPWSAKQPDERALWLAAIHPHQPMGKQAIALMARGYARAAGIERSSRTHLWRHTCATHLVAAGTGIAIVQRLLGHHSLRMTQKYTRVFPNDVKKMHARLHPRACLPASAIAPIPITQR